MNASKLRLTWPPLTRRQWWWLMAVASAFLAAGWPTFAWMAERFDAHDSFYSHGWLVPLASGWLIWQRRQVLRTVPLAGSFAGLALLLPSLAVLVLANWWRLGFVGGFALLGVVWGLVWTWWGWPLMRALRFPLLFLLFMVPLPGVLLIAISFKMKLLAAAMATGCIHMAGVPALQGGSTIQVPGATVIVDDTCSGLRSLISLITLSTLWAAFMPATASRWQKAAVVASALPIALIANMVRILVLVFLAAVYGPEASEGFLHYGSGFVVFGVALVVLAWFSQVIQRGLPSCGLNPSR